MRKLTDWTSFEGRRQYTRTWEHFCRNLTSSSELLKHECSKKGLGGSSCLEGEKERTYILVSCIRTHLWSSVANWQNAAAGALDGCCAEHTATCCWVRKPMMHTVLFADSSQTSLWMTALKKTGSKTPLLWFCAQYYLIYLLAGANGFLDFTGHVWLNSLV